MNLLLLATACLTLVSGVRYTSLSTPAVSLTSTCIGSDQPCEGNSCCPGFTGSLGHTFPCPTANATFNECDVATRYDLYNASLMDFTHVLIDQMSAETEGTGEAVITGVGWWLGQRLDLYVQSVNEFGQRTPLGEDTFKAIKPQENGRLLRFDFQARASGYFHFNLGRWENAVWTSYVMPWTTVTLMDIDCGGRRGKCETVTSTDHSDYDAGEQVKVTQNGRATTFADTLVSGAENNPTSVVLTEEQQSIAVALYFENTSAFTLHMANDAKWPRTFLLSGISSVQWPSIYTPAPTPFPTPPPTEARAHPPMTTPVPTPSPTCPFSSVSGNCEVDCICIGSPNYPENYPADASCVIGVAVNATLEVKDFNTEVFWDTLVVNGENFYGTSGPDRIVAEGVITFTSDGTDQDRGWHMCAVLPTLDSSPSPPYPTASMELEGPCEFFGEGDICVQSPNYPSEYDDYEHCTIRFTESTTLYVGDFFTEKSADWLTVDSVVCSGQTCPEQFNVTTSSEIEWSSDWGTVHRGWRVCTQAVPPPPVPAPSGPIDPLFRQVGISASSPVGSPAIATRTLLGAVVGAILGLILFWLCMKGCCIVSQPGDSGTSSDEG